MNNKIILKNKNFVRLLSNNNSNVNIGVVKFYNPEKHTGHIFSKEGKEIFFHKNSILCPKINYLESGEKVKYVLAKVEDRTQAINIRLLEEEYEEEK
eukprot:gene2273-2447_t